MPKRSHLPDGWHTVTPRIFVGDYRQDRPTELRIGESIVMVSGAQARDVMPACLCGFRT